MIWKAVSFCLIWVVQLVYSLWLGSWTLFDVVLLHELLILSFIFPVPNLVYEVMTSWTFFMERMRSDWHFWCMSICVKRLTIVFRSLWNPHSVSRLLKCQTFWYTLWLLYYVHCDVSLLNPYWTQLYCFCTFSSFWAWCPAISPQVC